MRLVILTGASGSGKTAIADAWQRAMTLAWMARIAGMSGQERAVLFEGQMRPAFVREGLFAAGIADSNPMLVDCDDETLARRLVANPNQPELTNATMMNWAAHLRREAQEAGYEILDTSRTPLEASVAHVAYV